MSCSFCKKVLKMKKSELKMLFRNRKYLVHGLYDVGKLAEAGSDLFRDANFEDEASFPLLPRPRQPSKQWKPNYG